VALFGLLLSMSLVKQLKLALKKGLSLNNRTLLPVLELLPPSRLYQACCGVCQGSTPCPPLD
jgi:hypothetical protein